MKSMRHYLPVMMALLCLWTGQSLTAEQPAGAGLQALRLGSRVLALYKSSEGQSEGENEIVFHVAQPLKKMGLSVSYWDLDRGIPGAKELDGVRALISWFRGPSLKDPEAYLDFLERSVDSGIKLVVLDNFGAYQNRRSKVYLEPARINTTLSRLGLMYFGEWSEDPKVLRIAQKDRSMVEWQGRQDPGISRLYYRFIPVDRDLKVYLSLKRTDRPFDPSPVIVANRHGGFALSRYLYHYQEGKLQMLLNVEAFLKEALFPGPREERIALLVDSGDATTAQVLDYATGVLKRAKLPFEVIRREAFSSLLPGDLRRFTALGLVLSRDSGLDPEVLSAYLRDGGGIVALQSGNFSRLASVLAMGEAASTSKEGMGFNFPAGFLLGEGLTLKEPDLPWTAGSRKPNRQAKILARSYDGSLPLLWTATMGQGRVLVWNWDAFVTGEFQGFLLESFLFVRPVGVAATAGLGLMFIDDWPMPMYNAVKSPLSIPDTEFYVKVWWPEMKKLFADRKIPYDSYLVFNYNHNITPPFTVGEFYMARNQESQQIAREILESREELGLHGYNHVSLSEKPTELNEEHWPSQQAMRQSLEQAKREWINLFGPHTLPFSYVAPHNIISAQGIEALHQVFPSIKVVSSLRSGTGVESRFEFGPDPNIPELYHIPRTSSGFPFHDMNRRLTVAAIAGAGIWSHFIHADDIFDPARALGRDWKGLKRELGQLLDFIDRHYPWLRYVSIREAYQVLNDMDNTGLELRQEGEQLHICCSRPGMLLRLRLNDYEAKKLEGLRVVYRYRKMPALIVETTAATAQLTLARR